MSQTELAQKVRLRQQTIAKIEAGTRPLRMVEASDIAVALEVPLSALDDRPNATLDDLRADRLGAEMQLMQAEVIDRFLDLVRTATLLQSLVTGNALSPSALKGAEQELEGFGPGHTVARLAWMVESGYGESATEAEAESPPF